MSIFDMVIISRQRVLFFLIDTSSSMSGTKIEAVNTTIQEVVPYLREVDAVDVDVDVDLKIAVMRFSTEAEWITASGPVAIGQFSWKNITTGGETNLGAACKELNVKLSKGSSFIQAAGGSCAPLIFLFLGGSPTDDIDSSINELWKNNWFRQSKKVAVDIGKNANKDVLEHFTGNSDSVVDFCSAEMIQVICEDALKVGAIRSDQADVIEKSRRMALKEKLDKIRKDTTEGGW
ncbi:MAG: hypothetical protein LBV68_08100 [Spirochaetaceae bacterium]|jgi:uncharacterized protein YegL|nr:hypothetical protein [Spirochaetaceae bacterium]